MRTMKIALPVAPPPPAITFAPLSFAAPPMDKIPAKLVEAAVVAEVSRALKIAFYTRPELFI